MDISQLNLGYPVTPRYFSPSVIHVDASRVGGLCSSVCVFVCLFVCFPCDISKTDADLITRFTERFHHESWKPSYFGVKRSRSQSRKQFPRGFLHSSEFWLLPVLNLCLLMGQSNTFHILLNSTPACLPWTSLTINFIYHQSCIVFSPVTVTFMFQLFRQSLL